VTAFLICWALAGVVPRSAVAVLPSGAEFMLEIAADGAARSRGYMGREKVGPREGMLFIFEEADRHPFWMKNCRVSLDIIWLDATFRVVDIAPNRPPCPEVGECPEVAPVEPAAYVLEVAGGTTLREGLKRGDRIVVLEEPPLP
jgi:uncharacterized membrane protein (UPF0127 family)